MNCNTRRASSEHGSTPRIGSDFPGVPRGEESAQQSFEDPWGHPRITHPYAFSRAGCKLLAFPPRHTLTSVTVSPKSCWNELLRGSLCSRGPLPAPPTPRSTVSHSVFLLDTHVYNESQFHKPTFLPTNKYKPPASPSSAVKPLLPEHHRSLNDSKLPWWPLCPGWRWVSKPSEVKGICFFESVDLWSLR